jgi:transposase InsO family protein
VSRAQSNGSVERLYRTLLDEHFAVEGCKTWVERVEEMQPPLDADMACYNTKRPPQWGGMKGKTPGKAFPEGIPKLSRLCRLDQRLAR